MAVPDDDLQQIRRWAAGKTPPEFAATMRIEVDIAGPIVTIIDYRPEDDPPWNQQEVARLRWTAKYGTWSLYWIDRNSRWHLYDRVPPTARISTHLNEIDADPTCIFWG